MTTPDLCRNTAKTPGFWNKRRENGEKFYGGEAGRRSLRSRRGPGFPAETPRLADAKRLGTGWRDGGQAAKSRPVYFDKAARRCV